MFRCPVTRIWPVVASAIVLAATAAAAWATTIPVAVKAQPNPIREFGPAVSASYFAWSQTSKTRGCPGGRGFSRRRSRCDATRW
jgi:hypothetical protein